MPPKRKASSPWSLNFAVAQEWHRLALQAAIARGGEPAQVLGAPTAVAPSPINDVEGRGACGIFAGAGSTCMKMVPHAAPAQVINDEGVFLVQGDLAAVSVPERLCEMWARDEVCCKPAQLARPPSHVPCIGVVVQISEIGYEILTNHQHTPLALLLHEKT